VIGATDPGATTGVGIFAGPTPAFTKLEDPTVAQVRAILKWSKAAATQRGEPLHWVIEDQYAKIRMVHGPGGRLVPNINFESIKSLIRAAGVWSTMCEDLGIPFEWVYPETWQSVMLKSAPAELDGKKLSTKQQAQIVVRATWDEVVRFTGTPDSMIRIPSSKVPQDPCDAVLLGRWWQLHGSKRR
jgi:hypothetical protein